MRGVPALPLSCPVAEYRTAPLPFPTPPPSPLLPPPTIVWPHIAKGCAALRVPSNGLLELQRLDDRVAPYAKTLFSEASKRIIRDNLDKEAEEKLNRSIQLFLALLAQYMLLRPAHKVLEYLIRVYRVNEINKDDLLHAALPYHATRTFGRLVQLCLGRYAQGMSRSKPYWAALGSSRKKGAPVDRATLVNYCSNTAGGLGLLTAVADNLKLSSEQGIESSVHVSFYSALVTEVIAQLGAPTDALLQQLLPHVAAGLQRTPHVDYVAASLVISAQISAAAQLTEPVYRPLIDAVAKAAGLATVDSVRRDAVRCLVVLFQTQQPPTFPRRAFADVTRLPKLTDMLLATSARQVSDDAVGDESMAQAAAQLSDFVDPLLRGLVERCLVADLVPAPAHFTRLLLGLISSDIAMAAHATTLTQHVLELCATRQGSDVAAASDIVGALQLKCPTLVEKGVALFASGAAPAVPDAAYDLSIVGEVVSKCTGSGRHTLVAGAGTTLLLSLQHSTSAVRKMGMQTLLDTIAMADKDDKEQAELLQDCLHVVLAQRDSDLLGRVLKLPRLLEFVDTGSILPVLEDTVGDNTVSANNDRTAIRALNLTVNIANDAADDLQLRTRCLRLVLASLVAAASGSDRLQAGVLEAAARLAPAAPLFRRVARGFSSKRLDAAENGAGTDGAAQGDRRQKRRRFIKRLAQRMATNVCSAVNKVQDSTSANDPAALKDASAILFDSQLSTACKGLGLMVLTTALNLLKNSAKVSAVERICQSILQFCIAHNWAGKISTNRALLPCWDEESALPPKSVLSQFLRVGSADCSLPQQLLLHAMHSVVARLPRIDMATLPFDLLPSSLILPDYLVEHTKESDGPIDSTGATVQKPTSELDSSDAEDAAPGKVSPKQVTGKTVLSPLRRSPRLVSQTRPEVETFALDGSIAKAEDAELELQTRVVASIFVVITASIDAQHATPIVQALLSRHVMESSQKIKSTELHPMLRFLRLFWSSRFPTQTQLYSVHICVTFLHSAAHKVATSASLLTGSIFSALQQTTSGDARAAFLALFSIVTKAGKSGLPASVATAVIESSSSLLTGTGNLSALLTAVLSPAVESANTAVDVTDEDSLKALCRLTELSVSGKGGPITSDCAAMLSLLRSPLAAWAQHRKASKSFLAPLRKFVKSCIAEKTAPVSHAHRNALQVTFAILSAAVADASGNFALLEAVLSRSLRHDGSDTPSGQSWNKLLWEGALLCVNDGLVPADNLPMQKRVMTVLLDACSRADPSGTSAIHQAIGRLPLQADAILHCISVVKAVAAPEADPMDALLGTRPSKSRKRSAQATATEVQQTDGVSDRSMIVLEVLQYKKDLLGNAAVLVPRLMGLLKTEIGSSTGGDEYSKQLLLSAMQWIAERGPPKGSRKDPGEVYDVSALVDCMQSNNSATRNHTLLLLSALATLSPKTVLARIVPVYTGVGAKTLQVEDSYSMNVIQQILRTVVPPVLGEGGGNAVHALVDMVVAAVPSMPEHRRVPLVSCLVSIMSPRTYLHGVLLQFLSVTEDSNSVTKMTMSDLCMTYTAATTLTAFANVVGVLGQEFADADTPTEFVTPYGEAIGTQFASLAQRDRYARCTTALTFVNKHLSDRRFLKMVVLESDPSLQSSSDLDPACLRLFKVLLVYLRHVMELRRQFQKQAEEVDKSTQKLVRQLESTVFACLSTVQQLLAPSGFVDAITSLLAHRDHKVRHRALQLMKDMLQNPSPVVDHSEKILSVLPTLEALLSRQDSPSSSATDSTRRTSMSNEIETPQNKQLVLICIGVMCKSHGASNSAAFVSIVRTVAATAMHPNIQLVSSALLCLASLGAQFGPLLLPHLALLVSRLNDGLASDATDGRSKSSSHTALKVICSLAAMTVLVQHVGRFFGPHVDSVLRRVLQADLLEPSTDASEWPLVPAKLEQVLELLATSVPPRQLYQPLFGALDYALEQGRPSVLALCRTVNQTMTAATRDDIRANQQLVFGFFTGAFEKLQAQPLDTALQEAIVTAFGALVLKLSESQFKPLFSRLCDWGIPESGASEGMGDSDSDMSRSPKTARAPSMQFNLTLGSWRKTVLFYRVVVNLADSLKGIIIPYFRYFLEHLVRHLGLVTDACFQQTGSSLAHAVERKRKRTQTDHAAEVEAALILADAATDVTRLLFLYDTDQDVATDAKILDLVDPLAAQLDCTFGLSGKPYD